MTQQKLTEKKTCFDSITGLRGIACLCIVCYHFYCLHIDDPGLGRELEPWYPWSKYFFEYSKNASEMFFLISGFLIAWHYRNQIGKLSFGTFFRQRYGKLIGASVFVNLWALVNVWLMTGVGMGAETVPVTVPRFLLSLLMINTGWFTSYARTGLPVCSTMWYIDVLLLCYMFYYAVGRIGKDRRVYIALCAGMVLLGWICLDHTPRMPFLWSFDGRGYVPFFLGVLLSEFQRTAAEKRKRLISLLWGAGIAAFFLLHTIVGFERVFGPFGTKSYIRYFEFAAAPGILLCALNLKPIREALSWRPLVWLGGLSASIYYVHNSLMEDYKIVNTITGAKIDFLSEPVFLLVIASVIPFAVLFQRSRLMK